MKVQKWKDINCEAHIEIGDTMLEFEVFEITSWTKNEKTDEYDVPSGEESLIRGTIKWDACSHVWFGDEGYIHLCGGRSWFTLMESLKRIWEIAMKELPESHSEDMFDLELFKNK